MRHFDWKPCLESELQHWIDQGYTMQRVQLDDGSWCYRVEQKASLSEPIYFMERTVS